MNKKILKKMFEFTKNKKETIKIGIMISLTMLVYGIFYPFIMQVIVDYAIPKENIVLVLILSAILILVVAFRFLKDRYIEIRRKYCIYNNNAQIKNELFENIQNSSTSELDKIQAGNLFQIVGPQSFEASQLFVWNFVGIFCVRLMSILIIALVLLILDLKLGAIIITIFAISYMFLIPMYKKNMKVYRKLQKIIIDLQGEMNEYIEAYSTTKTLRLEETNLSKIDEILKNCKTEIIKSNKINSIHNALFSLLTFASVIVVLIVGGNKMSLGIMTSSVIMLMVDYIDDINRHMKSLLDHVHGLLNRYNCFLNVLNITKLKKEVDTGTKKLDSIESIEFKNVVLSYDGINTVLDNINFKVDKPIQIAIVGKSGVGKTSLVNLLPRLYDISSGSILINGIDYMEYKLEELRKNIAYVFQEPVIFEKSILENIRMGCSDKVKLNHIKKICREIGLASKIESLQFDYDTIISSKTDILSYGEKQLLCFARAILKDTDVVILDEVTSNLDLRFEEQVMKATDKMLKGKICFVIAHRLNTIKNSDIIMFIDDKKIVEMGTHDELIKKHGYYYNLYMSKSK